MSAGLLCGVDVGASKSDCVVCTGSGELLGRVIGEPGAIQRFGPEHVAPIRKIVEQSCTALGLDPSRLRVISVGLAGADSPELTKRACSARSSRLSLDAGCGTERRGDRPGGGHFGAPSWGPNCRDGVDRVRRKGRRRPPGRRLGTIGPGRRERARDDTASLCRRFAVG